MRIEKLYEHIYTDGIHYKEKETNRIISKVYNFEFAAIYEIGRIIRLNLPFKLPITLHLPTCPWSMC